MIYLVRHGESEANFSGRFCGITNVELSLKGREEAVKAGNNLKNYKIEFVYSSPLKRAIDTAEIICDRNGIDLSEIMVEDCLIEVNFGLFENLTWDEIREQYREESENWILNKQKYKFPEGDSYADIIKRVSRFIEKIPDNSLVVTHFGVIQSILLYLNIADDTNLWDYVINNCDIVIIDKNKKELERIIRNSILESEPSV